MYVCMYVLGMRTWASFLAYVGLRVKVMWTLKDEPSLDSRG